MKYTEKIFLKEFPNDSACLDYIFRKKYPELVNQYYRVRGRKSYADVNGHQLYPLKNTIFEKSATPLPLWFRAIYLFSINNSISAKEIERQLNITYKTAWKIINKIRRLQG